MCMKFNTDGELHCEDGPAIIWPSGTEEWYFNGKLHREDGPAVVDVGGKKEWWRHGVLHRDDGPAYVLPRGYEEYWVNGELHRDDGPAINWTNRKEQPEWHFEGECLKFLEWCRRAEQNDILMKLKW